MIASLLTLGRQRSPSIWAGRRCVKVRKRWPASGALRAGSELEALLTTRPNEMGASGVRCAQASEAGMQLLLACVQTTVSQHRSSSRPA